MGTGGPVIQVLVIIADNRNSGHHAAAVQESRWSAFSLSMKVIVIMALREDMETGVLEMSDLVSYTTGTGYLVNQAQAGELI